MPEHQGRLITWLEKSRTLYIIINLEPYGLRNGMIGHIFFPLVIGFQFILVPQERWRESIFVPILDVVPADIIGVTWIGFALWMLFIMRFVRRPIMGIYLVWSASFYLFWTMVFGVACYATGNPGLIPVLTLFFAWSLFSCAQSFIYRQIDVDGPRANEFK